MYEYYFMLTLSLSHTLVLFIAPSLSPSIYLSVMGLSCSLSSLAPNSLSLASIISVPSCPIIPIVLLPGIFCRPLAISINFYQFIPETLVRGVCMYTLAAYRSFGGLFLTLLSLSLCPDLKADDRASSRCANSRGMVSPQLSVLIRTDDASAY